jgi:3-isopropylmalate/(R)-2-methylmalate dehydratase large subunit
MSIEAGARAGLIAPDETTFDYLAGRTFAPAGDAWDEAVNRWKALPSDEGADYDREIRIDATSLEPMITFGTNPGMSIPLNGRLPDPETAPDTTSKAQLENALRYMSLQPRQPLVGHPIQVVFIGSCTNGRLSDLREAAKILRGRRVHSGVRTLVVPGSVDVKKRAEAEGLDRIFKDAGAEWREPGCSMCIAMNGDQLQSGESAVSTSNRNFEGRQGPGSRTFLASPLTAAASAVEGRIADARRLATT